MSWLKAKDWATGVEYSSLFHSGLRAIARAPRAHRPRAHSSSPSLQEPGSSGGTPSIVPLPSRLLRRSTTRSRHPGPATSHSTDPSPTPPPRAPKRKRQRPSSMLVLPTGEVGDVWSSGGNFIEFGDCPKYREEESCNAGYFMPPIEMDALRSLAGSRSFFVNLDAAPVSPTGEQSLLLSSDSPVPGRERPVSMQTLPRRDGAWMLEESSPELKTYEGEDERDVADWRQFHVDLLRAIH